VIEKIQAIKNIGTSWLSLGLSLVIGFFLSPFILHRLGDEAFGLWVLIYSISDYYSFFDFGIRSSVIRYVANFHATGNQEQLTRLISTALTSYSCIGILLLLVTGVGSLFVGLIFHVSAAWLSTVRLLFVIVGSGLALGFPLGVFSGVMEGLQKFHILNITQIISTLLRALLVLLVLSHGQGLLSVAIITMALPLVTALVRAKLVLRMLPLDLGLSHVDRSTLRQIVSYSGVTFIAIVADRLRFRSDALIIGAFLSTTAITFFAIGSKLVDYATEVVETMAQIFTPMSSQLDARGDFRALGELFVIGNRSCALIMLPLSVALITLGKPLISVWVGPRYLSSYPVMLALLLPSTLWYMQATSFRVLYGMGKHLTFAIAMVIEGVVNVVLSIWWVRHYGIMGDAMGTAIPLLVTAIFFLPGHLCRLLGIPLLTYFRRAFVVPILLASVLTLTLLLLQHLIPIRGYSQLISVVAIGSIVYAGLLWFTFATQINEVWQETLRVSARFVGKITDRASQEDIVP